MVCCHATAHSRAPSGDTMSLRNLPRPSCLVATTLVLALLPSGCGDGGVGKTYRVSGTVTINGKPLVAKSAVVLFKPNAARSNTSSFEPTATVDSSGNYTLYTKTKRGAPPGWYKVTVTAVVDSTDPPKGALTKRPLPRSLVPAKYGQEKTTPIEIEV